MRASSSRSFFFLKMKTDAQIFHSRPLNVERVKTLATILVGAYFFWAAAHPDRWRLVDGVNLVIHEAGHLLFRPFGEFMMISGGSLFQVIVPLVFAGYFYRRKSYFSCALILFWVGESLLNVSVYAADAQWMQLPLLGGDDSIHDWNYLLDRLNLLRQTDFIARAIRIAGTLTIVFAFVWGILAARRPSPQKRDRSRVEL